MNGRQLRLAAIVREAILNILGHPVTSGLAVAASLLAGTLVPALTAWEVGALEARAEGQVLAGATVLTISAKDRVPLSAARCDALRRVEGVAAAGGAIASSTVHAADGSPVTMLRATAGYADVVWPAGALRRDVPQSVVSGVLLGARAGLSGPGVLSGLVLDGAPIEVRIDQVAASSPRIPIADRAIVVAEPASGGVVECLVEAEQGALAGVEAVAVAWFPAELETSTTSFAPSLEPVSVLDDSLANRLSSVGAPLGAVLCALGMATSWLARRGDFALYRSFGMSSARLLLALSVETIVLNGLGLVLGSAAVVVALEWSPLALKLAVQDEGALAALVVLLPVMGLTLSPHGRGLNTLRGR